MLTATIFLEMIHNISDTDLKRLLTAAAEIGAINALQKTGVAKKDEISQREAYRRFGESRVKLWAHRGLIKKIKLQEKNSKVTYSLCELEALSHIAKL